MILRDVDGLTATKDVTVNVQTGEPFLKVLTTAPAERLNLAHDGIAS